MIYIFRKEMKKWKVGVLGVVLVSLALGGVSTLVFTFLYDDKGEVVARVNGTPVYLKSFQHAFAEKQDQINDLALYLKMSVERVAGFFGIKNLEDHIFNKLISGALLSKIAGDLSLQIDEVSFHDTLGESMNRFADSYGQINMKAYQNYLSKLHMGIVDYEATKAEGFSQDMVKNFIGNSSYLPSYVKEGLQKQAQVFKRFSVIEFSHKHFLDLAKQKDLSEKEIEAFYKKNKELYREVEKKRASYWTLSAKEYESKISVDSYHIEQYYEKNKSSLYRIPPEVSVRIIVFLLPSDASPDLMKNKRELADSVREKALADPKQFESLAKKHSQDKSTADQGGLVKHFKRGTHDPEFEKVAFVTLKNTDDISEVVRTERGLEIIKLEDRIPAKSKPLDTVRDDVVKRLKTEKAALALHADLEAVLHSVKADSTVFDKFAKQNKLKQEVSGWIIKDMDAESGVAGQLSQCLFSGQKKKERYGYFVYDGSHVLYQLAEKKESFIPKLDELKSQVREGLLSERARELQIETIARVKQSALEKNGLFEQAAKKDGLSVVECQKVNKQGSLSEFPGVSGIVEKAFCLHDSYPVVEYSNENDFYLVRLLTTESAKEKEGAEDVSEEEGVAKQRCTEAFIASLQRNATISKDVSAVKEYARTW